jgi:predicted porin
MSSSKSRFMKKVSFTALAVAFAAPAFAADANPVTVGTSGSFKFYGNLDSGVEVVTNAKIGTTTNTGTVVRVPSTTGTTPSNLGIDVSKDAGPVKGIAKLEMGIYTDAGNSGQGGRLFGRQLYVGVDSGAGTFTVGRQNNMMYWGTIPGDLLGPNIYGTGSIDPYLPNARYDNSIAWRGKFDAVTVGAAYSFGYNSAGAASAPYFGGAVPLAGSCSGETAGDAQACRAMSLLFQYITKDFGISAAYDQLHGGPLATYSFYNGIGGSGIAIASSADTDTRTTLNGFYKLDALKLGAGWLERKVDTGAATTPKQTMMWLQADYVMSQWDFTGGVFNVSQTGQTTDTKANMLALRAIYNFDDQLSTYVTLGYMGNDDKSGYGVSGGGAGTAPVVGKKQDGLMIGARYHF